MLIGLLESLDLTLHCSSVVRNYMENSYMKRFVGFVFELWVVIFGHLDVVHTTFTSKNDREHY